MLSLPQTILRSNDQPRGLEYQCYSIDALYTYQIYPNAAAPNTLPGINLLKPANNLFLSKCSLTNTKKMGAQSRLWSSPFINEDCRLSSQGLAQNRPCHPEQAFESNPSVKDDQLCKTTTTIAVTTPHASDRCCFRYLSLHLMEQ